jgi:endonuclease YncB( thermonuclease family)
MYEYGCKITRVVDGDTVDADIDLGFSIKFKSRIRLYGVDNSRGRISNSSSTWSWLVYL